MMSKTTTGFVKMTKCGKHGKLKNSFPHLQHFFENFQMKTVFENFQHFNKIYYFFYKYFKKLKGGKT